MGKHKTCNHLAQAPEYISATTTKECEECKKEGTNWVALRLCLSCSHVGCCDSSPGRHATRHFIDTDHPVMVALPNKHGDGATFTKLMDKRRKRLQK